MGDPPKAIRAHPQAGTPGKFQRLVLGVLSSQGAKGQHHQTSPAPGFEPAPPGRGHPPGPTLPVTTTLSQAGSSTVNQQYFTVCPTPAFRSHRRALRADCLPGTGDKDECVTCGSRKNLGLAGKGRTEPGLRSPGQGGLVPSQGSGRASC